MEASTKSKTVSVAGEEVVEAKGSRAAKDITSQNNHSSSKRVARLVVYRRFMIL